MEHKTAFASIKTKGGLRLKNRTKSVRVKKLIKKSRSEIYDQKYRHTAKIWRQKARAMKYNKLMFSPFFLSFCIIGDLSISYHLQRNMRTYQKWRQKVAYAFNENVNC